MKEKGARLHPNSGAGSIKDDGSDDERIYEVKSTARSSYILPAHEMLATFNRANRQGRIATWLIYFEKHGFTAEIHLVPGTGGVLGMDRQDE